MYQSKFVAIRPAQASDEPLLLHLRRISKSMAASKRSNISRLNYIKISYLVHLHAIKIDKFFLGKDKTMKPDEVAVFAVRLEVISETG